MRDICDDFDVLMIADEVITGFGRTGRWFGVQHEDVVPDLMSVAKGITSGYLPLSASIASRKIADAFDEHSHEENVHPGTYAGHPVSCAAALANLAIIERENLVDNAVHMGERLHATIEKHVHDLPIVGEVQVSWPHAGSRAGRSAAQGSAARQELVSSLNMRAWKRGAVVVASGTVLRRRATAFHQRGRGRRARADHRRFAARVAGRRVAFAVEARGSICLMGDCGPFMLRSGSALKHEQPSRSSPSTGSGQASRRPLCLCLLRGDMVCRTNSCFDAQ